MMIESFCSTVFFFLLGICHGFPTTCGTEQNTQVFRSSGTNNSDNFYFVTKTFDNAMFDPCTPITANAQFREMINNRIRCVGKWCSSKGDFDCNGKGTTK